MMQFTLVTLFPSLFDAFFAESLVGRAVNAGELKVHLEDLRLHGVGRHRNVDDTPYGGGSGMVMRADSVVGAIESAETQVGSRAHRVLLTPQGEPLSQAHVGQLAGLAHLLLVCGRYEGFDERVRHFVDSEVSLGDFVMIGGEVAAMALIESVARLQPGVLGNPHSATEESFSSALAGGLEYPHYTRPAEFRGHRVPEVLTSGDHARIADWRRHQAHGRTLSRRPELLRPATSGKKR